MLDYLPAHYCKRNRLFSTYKNPERRINDSYHRERTKSSDKSLDQLYRQYLQICWEKPYYGYLCMLTYQNLAELGSTRLAWCVFRVAVGQRVTWGQQFFLILPHTQKSCPHPHPVRTLLYIPTPSCCIYSHPTPVIFIPHHLCNLHNYTQTVYCTLYLCASYHCLHMYNIMDNTVTAMVVLPYAVSPFPH